MAHMWANVGGKAGWTHSSISHFREFGSVPVHSQNHRLVLLKPDHVGEDDTCGKVVYL